MKNKNVLSTLREVAISTLQGSVGIANGASYRQISSL